MKTNSTITDVIRSRRTINDFRPEPPPEPLILRAIELACWAPNHKLTQPWRFYLLGPRTVSAIVELNAELAAVEKGAAAGQAKREKWSQVPGWLAVTTRRSADAVRDREDYAATCCAIQNLALFLWSEGVGVKWTTGAVTRDAEFRRLIGIDDAEEGLAGLLWYGYPARVPDQQRKAVEEVVRRLP